MDLNLYVDELQLLDAEGNEIIPDENGIVTVKINGNPRRFVKDKLLNWITKNGLSIPSPKRPRKKSKARKKRKPNSKPARSKKWERLKETVRSGTGITATKDGKVYGPFVSIAACEKGIGVTKSWIAKCLKKGKDCKGFKLKKV